jgi:F-type H+-transporting ATPase subunit gamma
MATLKQVKLKIAAVKKTKQITKAMNMVAASRLRGAQANMEGFRPYAAKFAEVLGNLAGSGGEQAGELIVPRETVKKVHIVLCSSDRGLCGGFNSSLIDKASKLAQEKQAQGMEVTFTAFGKNGRDWLKRNKYTIASQHIGVVGSKVFFSTAAGAGRLLVNGYREFAYDQVYIVYAEFISMSKQLAVSKQLLPIPPIAMEENTQKEDTAYQAEHICEPSATALLGELLPRSVDVQIFSALLETSTSEHAARMLAMDNATKACNDMIGNLTLAYNKARQASITAELIDIVGGAEALKG